MMTFSAKFITCIHIDNYSNIAVFDKVIATIKWCSFLPNSV